MRIIKIITPSNECLNIEFNSKENEIRDLISMLTNIPPKEIKGICDRYGTNYTLSYAVNSPAINNDFSDFYYLVTKNQQHPSNVQSINQEMNYCTPNYFQVNNNGNNSMNQRQKYSISPFQHPQNRNNNKNNNFNMSNNNNNYNSPYYNNQTYQPNQPSSSVPHYNSNNLNSFNQQNNFKSPYIYPNYLNNVQQNEPYQTQPNYQNFIQNNYDPPMSYQNSQQTHQTPLYDNYNIRFGQPLNGLNSNLSNLDFNNRETLGMGQPIKFNNFNNNNNNFNQPLQSNQFNKSNLTQNPRFYSQERNTNSNQSKRSFISDRFGLDRQDRQEYKQDRPDYRQDRQEINEVNMEKYLNIVKYLHSNNLINQMTTITLQKLITEENEVLIDLFINFLTDKISINQLVYEIENNLNETSLNTTQEINRPTTAMPQRKNFLNVLEELPNSIFEEPSDQDLLKKLAMSNYNEIIKSTWEVFSSDKDYENFVDTLRRIIAYHKQHRNEIGSSSSNFSKSFFKRTESRPDSRTDSKGTSRPVTRSGTANTNNADFSTIPIRIGNLGSLALSNINIGSGGNSSNTIQSINSPTFEENVKWYNSNNFFGKISSNTNSPESNEMNSKSNSSNINNINNLNGLQGLSNIININDNPNNNKGLLHLQSTLEHSLTALKKNQIVNRGSFKSSDPIVNNKSNIDNNIFDKRTLSELEDKRRFSTVSHNSNNSLDNYDQQNNSKLINQDNNSGGIFKTVSAKDIKLDESVIKNELNNTATNLNYTTNNISNLNMTTSLTNITFTNNAVNSSQNAIRVGKSASSKRNSFDEKLGNKLKKNLHTWQLGVVNYFVHNELPQKDEIIKKRNEFKDNDDVYIKTVKNICYKFIQDNVLKDFPKQQALYLAEMINSRTPKITLIFKKFFETKNLEGLKEDLHLVINNEESNTAENTNQSNKLTDKTKQNDNKQITEKGKSIKTDVNKQQNSPQDKDGGFSIELKSNNNNSNNNNNLNISVNVSQNKDLNDEKMQYAYYNTMQLIKKLNILKEEEKSIVESLFSAKDPVVFEIFDNYIQTSNIQRLKNQIQLLHIKHVNANHKSSNNTNNYTGVSGSSTNINTNSNTNTNTNIELQKRISANNTNQDNNSYKPTFVKDSKSAGFKVIAKPFEKTILEYLLNDKISKQQYLLLIKRHSCKDENLLSIWEAYCENNNTNEFIKTLHTFTNNFLQSIFKPNGKSKSYTQELKIELKTLIKLTEEVNIEAYKAQQYRVIEHLIKDNLLNDKYLKTLEKLIIEEDSNVYAIFEIFYNKRDINDMIETLEMLAEINFSLEEKHEVDSSNETVNESNNKDTDRASQGGNRPPAKFTEEIFSKLFKNFKYANVFTPLEIGYLRTNFIKNDEAIISALECYSEDKDDEAFKIKLQNTLNKNKTDSTNYKQVERTANSYNSDLMTMITSVNVKTNTGNNTGNKIVEKESFFQKSDEFTELQNALNEIIEKSNMPKAHSDIHKELLARKDEFLIGTLKSYIRNNDVEDAVENLNLTYKKNKSIKSHMVHVDETAHILESYIEKEKLPTNEQEFLINLYYQNKNHFLHSTLEAYKQNSDYDELKESIDVILLQRRNTEKAEKAKTPTPIPEPKPFNSNVKASMAKQITFSKPKSRDSKDDDNPEMRFIRVLHKINKKFNFSQAEIDLLKDSYINKRNELLISAFEIYEKYGDDDDFFETLDIVIKKKGKDQNKKPSPSNKNTTSNSNANNAKTEETAGKPSQVERFPDKFRKLLKTFLSIHKQSQEDLDIILELINTKDEYLLACFESYDKNKDHDDFNENIHLAISKQRKKNPKEDKAFINAIKIYQSEAPLSSQQIHYLKAQYKTNDFLKSSIEAYGKNKNSEDLKENIDIVLKKFKETKETKDNKDNNTSTTPTPQHIDDIDEKFVSCMKELNNKYKLMENDFNILQICLIKNKQGKDHDALTSILESYIRNKDIDDFQESVNIIIKKEKENLSKFLYKFAKACTFKNNEIEYIMSKLNENNKNIIQALLNYNSHNDNYELKDLLQRMIRKEDKKSSYSTSERELISKLNKYLMLLIDSNRKINQKEYDLFKKLLIEGKNKLLISAMNTFEKNKDLNEFYDAIKKIKAKYLKEE